MNPTSSSDLDRIAILLDELRRRGAPIELLQPLIDWVVSR